MHVEVVHTLAHEYGLVFRGGFLANLEDDVPSQIDGTASKTLLLFGQAGDSLWSVFSQSTELADNQPHPMDRWSERVGNAIAQGLHGRLLLPFGGPPHYPFIRWASRAEEVQPSKLGMLIHPIYGLWHAYRFAIAVAEPIDGLAEAPTVVGICSQCQDTPCLNTCPVGAFTDGYYDVKACIDYLQENPEAPCHRQGCLARDACPEGAHSHYDIEQKQFHMTQFTQALYKRLGDSENS